MPEEKTVFENLLSVNVNDMTEKKSNGFTELTYLTWSKAWAELQKRYYGRCSYEIERFGELQLPYQYDDDTGYMVWTKLTIDGITYEMWLPVMDGANKAMKNHVYTYKVKNSKYKYAKPDGNGHMIDKNGLVVPEYIDKIVEAATMMDIQKAIMRCLVKNIGMFGLGLYIYSGEDLPEDMLSEEERISKRMKAIGDASRKLLDVGGDIHDEKTAQFIMEKANISTVDKAQLALNESWTNSFVRVVEALVAAKKTKNAKIN